MEIDEFLEQMMEPEAGDTMVFQIDRSVDDGRTFSKEATDGMSDNMAAFAMARTYARWKETGSAPRRMTARLTISWDDEDAVSGSVPWWHVEDEGVKPLDGTDRLKAVGL